MSATRRVRLELDEGRAWALHAALSEALGTDLLAGEHREAARELLEQLDGRVPGWLEAGPVGGEAGYLLAAEAVLRMLVSAEDRGRHAPAGRQLLARGTAPRDDAWAVRDADTLLDLIYAEHRPGGRAHRPSVQAIGRLEDHDLEPLVADLLALGQLDSAGTNFTWLELSWEGIERARTRWRDSAPGGRRGWDGPPAPARPYRRELPILIGHEDRRHPDRCGEDTTGRYCMPAAWLARLEQDEALGRASTRRRRHVAAPALRHLVARPTCRHATTTGAPPTAIPPPRPTTRRFGGPPTSHDPHPAARCRCRSPAAVQHVNRRHDHEEAHDQTTRPTRRQRAARRQRSHRSGAAPGPRRRPSRPAARPAHRAAAHLCTSPPANPRDRAARGRA